MNARGALALLGLAAAAALVLHVVVGGSVSISAWDVLRIVAAGPGSDDPLAVIVWQIRLPRALAAAGVGALLAASGSAFQSLFRNPLAEPYVLGVSSGAALGGAAAIAFGFAAGLLLPVAALAGGALSLALALSLARAKGGVQVETLLIAGVVVGSMLSALLTLVLLLAGQDTNVVLRWLLGSLTPMSWEKTALVWGAAALLLPFMAGRLRTLNAMAMGEAAAFRSGASVDREKLWTLCLGTAMTGAAVGAAGVVPFLGLVAPHLARRWAGADARRSWPVATLLGAILLTVSDLVAQRVTLGLELPVGAVTAVLGAPALLWLLRRRS